MKILHLKQKQSNADLVQNQFFSDLCLTQFNSYIYACSVMAKSITSREKLNNLLVANSNTPFNRVIFVCSERTPKKNPLAEIETASVFSMVACYGQRLAVGCFPQVAVSHPVTRYRQAVRSVAVTLKSLSCGVTQMIFKFLLLGEKRLKISIRANSEQEARQLLNLTSPAILIARFSSAINGGQV